MASSENFGDMLQTAVKLKSAEMDKERPVFNNWPSYYQHTLFASEEIAGKRKLPVVERLKEAARWKDEGNGHHKDKSFADAIRSYEQALSIVKYCENKDPGWKKKGIRDADIRQYDILQDCDKAEENEARGLLLSLYLNLAACYLQTQAFGTCIKACNDALSIDKASAKAYFRRALARDRGPLSLGATKTEIGEDFRQAIKLAPGDRLIRQEYQMFLRKLKEQRQQDSQAFGGMFDRQGTTLYDPQEIERRLAGEKAERRKEAQQQIKDAQNLSQKLHSEGKEEEARQIEKSLGEISSMRAESLHKQSSKPIHAANAQNKKSSKRQKGSGFVLTAQLKDDAFEHGIDVSDPRVMAMMRKMHRVDQGDEVDDTQADYDREDLVDAVSLLSMEELTKFCRKHKIPTDKFTDKASLEDYLVDVLCSVSSSSERNHVLDLVDWRVVIVVAVLAALYAVMQSLSHGHHGSGTFSPD